MQNPSSIWNVQWIQALMGIAVLAGVGFAVFGQVKWRATQEFEALADARAQKILLLEKELLSLQESITKDKAFREVETRALEAQISEVQRLNLGLQAQLEELRKR